MQARLQMKQLLAYGQDAIGVTGFVLLAAGLALVAVPLALIVCGALLFGLAIWPWPQLWPLISRPPRGGD